MKKKFFNVFALIMVLVFTVVSCGEKKEEKKQDSGSVAMRWRTRALMPAT